MSPLPRDVPGTTLSSDGIESVRYAENIKAYPVNRYVDPANRGVMHEGHTIYRVETSPRWNLRPNQPVNVPLGPSVAVVRNPASHPGPLPGELTAELSRQKEATRTVIAQGERLGGSIDRLQAALSQTAEMAQEQRKMQADLNKAQGRIEQLEKDRSEKPRPVAVPTFPHRLRCQSQHPMGESPTASSRPDEHPGHRFFPPQRPRHANDQPSNPTPKLWQPKRPGSR